MTEPTEDFTVISCAYRRAYGPEQHDLYVRVDGEWVPIGSEDFGEGTWENLTATYERIEVVAVAMSPES